MSISLLRLVGKRSTSYRSLIKEGFEYEDPLAGRLTVRAPLVSEDFFFLADLAENGLAEIEVGVPTLAGAAAASALLSL